MLDSSRLDRNTFSVVTLAEKGDDDKAYWATKTPEERLEALELLRQIMYGYDPLAERLQRVFTVVEFPDET